MSRFKLKVVVHFLKKLKGQCRDYAHARASSVFSSEDNRTVILTRQDFLPDHTADADLLFIFSSNISDFQIRDGPLEKLWGGGEGSFRTAGIFFRYQISWMTLF